MLTTVLHELGHLLGLAHDDTGGLMSETLPLGTRRLGPIADGWLDDPLASPAEPDPLDSRLVDATFADDDVF